MIIYGARLAQDVKITLNCSDAYAVQCVRAVKDALIARLIKGDIINLAGLGTFRLKHVGAKRMRNLRTGASVKVEAHRCPGWLPSLTLKRKIRAGSYDCGRAP